MSIDSNMKMVGKRFPYLATYQVRGEKGHSVYDRDYVLSVMAVKKSKQNAKQ